MAEADVAGPFLQIPEKETDQAKLPALGYANPLERLAERFHTTPETLAAPSADREPPASGRGFSGVTTARYTLERLEGSRKSSRVA